ncbi:MAG: methyltransferase domain-containing protein [Myxococcota bacterium]|nr:methyltransferase domain-containing protein [Myxococcota bacterium]
MNRIIRNYIENSPQVLSLAKYIEESYRGAISKPRWKLLSKQKNIKLELGSGAKQGKNGWITVDMSNADIYWDLRKGIPLADCSVNKIYSSHLLEHIPYKQLIIFLQECRRVLRSDGEFSVCVPNFRFYVDAYNEGKLFRERDAWWEPGMIDTGSIIDQLNYLAYMRDEHKYMFDEEGLINTLLKAGFSEANLREFDQELDLLERDFESIYAVAKR